MFQTVSCIFHHLFIINFLVFFKFLPFFFVKMTETTIFYDVCLDFNKFFYLYYSHKFLVIHIIYFSCYVIFFNSFISYYYLIFYEFS